MSTRIQIEYCGMSGAGATVKEAKQDAARKIEAALSNDYTPLVLVHGGNIVVIWDTPNNGLNSSYLHDGKLSGVCMHPSNETITGATDSHRLGLAQLAANVESNEVPSIISGDKRLVREYASWLGFQRAYRKGNGNDCAKHQWASEHGREFQPILA